MNAIIQTWRVGEAGLRGALSVLRHQHLNGWTSAYRIHQREYYEENPLLARNEFFEGPTMKLTEEQIQKKLRGFAGASLWVTQARFDVAYMVGMLGTKVIPSSRFAEV